MGKGVWTISDSIWLAFFSTMALVAVFSPDAALVMATGAIIATTPV